MCLRQGDQEVFCIRIKIQRRGLGQPPSLHFKPHFLRTLRHGCPPLPLIRSVKSRFQAVITSCLVLFLILTGCEQLDFSNDRKQIIERHFEKATKLYEQRDYHGAIAVYEDLLRKVPDEYEAHFKIAQIYFGNLNDYLNAAYHYQRYINSPDTATGQVELAKSLLENAKLQLAASVPNSGIQSSAELVKLRTENLALHKQVEDLKDELLTVRNKPPQPPNQNPPPTAPPVATVATPQTQSQPAPQPVTTPSTPKPANTSVPAPNPATSTSIPVVSKNESDTSIDTPFATTRPAPTTKPDLTPSSGAATSKTRTYVVKKGEGIQAIAEKIYGDRSKWRKIVAANPSIKDPDQLKPGQVLRLP